MKQYTGIAISLAGAAALVAVLFSMGVLREEKKETEAVTSTPPVSEAMNPNLSQSGGLSHVYSTQYEITEADMGKTFVYPLTSRFSVMLDGTKYAPQNLHCDKEGILGSISNIPSVAPSRFAKRFEAVARGLCTLIDGDFSVKIRVE